MLAARRLGVRSRLRLSNRLHYLVFETVLDGLVAVPRRQRYLPIVAGMLADVLVVAALTVCAALTRHPSGRVSLLGGICLALAFTTVIRIAWQFYFYLRTDVYYLVTTALGCVDLHTTTRELLRNRVNALVGRRERLVDESRWHPNDRRVARWYAPLVVVGHGASIAMLALVFLPLTWQFLGDAVRRLFLDDHTTAGQVWDSAGLLALTLFQLVLAGGLALRERRHRAGTARHTSRQGDRP